ncbi:unnamed protein product [Ceutorhynchus assimilis]|uniref:ETS domain-containing protein n=1 Tax=Ceutorhynchus assimilis TaxID=467358 RepID=A0A9N9MZA6_9CUCU|nr:unnamed protein product [Ceutorhynchus assimilis]
MILFAIIAIVLFIVYVKWRHSYWTRLGIYQMQPEFFIGNARSVLTGKTSFAQTVYERYNSIKATGQQCGGIYLFLEPAVYFIDPKLIKTILQKDFQYFMSHGLYHHPKDILSMNLFNMEGDVWRNLRAKLTPTFTSGKMKMMFDTIIEKTNGLEAMVDKFASNQQPFAIKEALGRFTTDIIGSCAFGIECNSLEDPDNLFRAYGKKVFEPNLYRFWLFNLLPWWFLGNIGFKSNGRDVSEFFIKVVKETIKTRQENQIFRKDFMHLLLELKNMEINEKNPLTITDDEIAAQCFIFFLAGFETSSTNMTFALLELAQNPEIQEKLRDEINDVIERHGGKITYDAVMEMKYLDMVINETLRKFPPVTILPRICTKDYEIPGTKSTIKKGTRVHIPVWGLHRDPDYYPDPDVFDPERFNEENKLKRPDFTFLPFGEGPRMCIGLRFGMLQSRVGLISLIRNFSFSLNKKTSLPIRMSSGSVIISVKGEVWLDAKKIRDY